MALAIDVVSDIDLVGTLRISCIMGNNVDENLVPGSNRFCPSILQRPVSASVEAGILGEMVEGVAWAIEANANIMAAIIGGEAILPTCLCLRTT